MICTRFMDGIISQSLIWLRPPDALALCESQSRIERTEVLGPVQNASVTIQPWPPGWKSVSAYLRLHNVEGKDYRSGV
jgi:hypothetical protein